MNPQEYRIALFKYFNVTSLEELRASLQWQEIEARENLTDLWNTEGLEKAYRAVFWCDSESLGTSGVDNSGSMENPGSFHSRFRRRV